MDVQLNWQKDKVILVRFSSLSIVISPGLRLLASHTQLTHYKPISDLSDEVKKKSLIAYRLHTSQKSVICTSICKEAMWGEPDVQECAGGLSFALIFFDSRHYKFLKNAEDVSGRGDVHVCTRQKETHSRYPPCFGEVVRSFLAPLPESSSCISF